MTQSVTWQIRELDGVTVRLDLTDPRHYTTRAFTRAGVQRVREVATSRTIDGEYDLNVRRGVEPLQLSLVVADTSMPRVDGRIAAVGAALDDPFVLVQFTTYGLSTAWRCRPADYASTTGPEDHLLLRRVINLVIPAAPVPVLTGAVAP